MRFNDLIANKNELLTAKTGKARVILQEEDPYDTYKALDGSLLTDWYNTFIGKLNSSFLDNKAAGMGQKEKAVYDTYTEVTVFTAADLYDQAVRNLDAYLATITTEDLAPTIVVAK